MTDRYRVTVTCQWPLCSPHLHPAAENIMSSHVCCVMQATFSLQVLKHSSCLRVKFAKFLHCLLPPADSCSLTPTQIAPTCCLQSQHLLQPPVPHNLWPPTISLHNCTHTQAHLTIPWPPVHLQPPQTHKPDTHPHSCLPEARSPEDTGLRARGV